MPKINIPFHLRVWDKLRAQYLKIKNSISLFLVSWHSILLANLKKYKKHWTYDHLKFAVTYGFLLTFATWSILGWPFDIFRIFGFGIAYYFFRFELFYWLRGIKK
jgi:hypothetical protein